MSEAPAIALASLAGTLLGAFFFGGLWWTVRRGLSARRPALWFFFSFALRTSVAAAGFYWAGGGRWERLLACFAGFALARWAVTARTREAGHAS